VFGTGVAIEDPTQKLEVLHALSDHLIPGRWEEVRAPTELELRQTLVVAVTIREASAKVRTGPPKDDEEDYALPVWAGLVPLRQTASAPIPDPRLELGIPPPPYAAHYTGPVGVHESGV
jgi:hypothetical protein